MPRNSVDKKGDSLYLVFRVGAETADYTANDYNGAVLAAKNRAAADHETYEVYAKIGQAIPDLPVKLPVT